MDKLTIQTLIDKVIGKKGLIRVPSWWMRKVLMQIADWVQEGDDVNDKKIVKVETEADAKITKVETEADNKITNLNSSTKAALVELKKSLHTQKCFVVKTGKSAGYVVVDGVKQDIPANTQKVVIFDNTFDFYDSSSKNQYLTFIGLAVTDTSSFTNMVLMFDNCSSLTSLDLVGLDTSAVTNMNAMFQTCSRLTSLDLSSFDTSAVTDMRQMFNECYALRSLDLSSFDTSVVTSMYRMFRDCHSLTSLDLSSFDTSEVTNMRSMFDSCSSLTSLNLSGFNTSKVESMYLMFNNCNQLTSLNLSSFDTSSVTTMYEIFDNCRSLTSLILGPNFFKTPNVTSIDFSSSTQWTNDTVVTSLVTNSYDRATAGLSTMTLQLSTNTKAALTDEQKAAITAKGYTIA